MTGTMTPVGGLRQADTRVALGHYAIRSRAEALHIAVGRQQANRRITRLAERLGGAGDAVRG
ncbi:hypothetical protein [Halochromatium sp.]